MTEVGLSELGGLEAILPANVSVAATGGDLPAATLFPEEAAAVDRAVEARRREFATARACARAALEPLGFSRPAIPVGARGEPRWPLGIVGSITHCERYRACAVARRADVLTIGIDAEPNRPLPDRVLAEVASEEEVALVGRLAAATPTVCWDRLLFSAKESIYKAWFPFARRRLGFGAATLTIDPRAKTFAARLSVQEASVPAGLENPMGRWTVDRGIVLTTIAVAR